METRFYSNTFTVGSELDWPVWYWLLFIETVSVRLFSLSYLFSFVQRFLLFWRDRDSVRHELFEYDTPRLYLFTVLMKSVV